MCMSNCFNCLGGKNLEGLCNVTSIAWTLCRHLAPCYELGACDIVTRLEADSIAGLAESDGVTSYPIVFMSFMTILNVTVM